MKFGYEKKTDIGEEEVVYLTLSKLLSSTADAELKTTVDISYKPFGSDEWQYLPSTETQEIRIVPPFGISNEARLDQSEFTKEIAKYIAIGLMTFALIACGVLFTVTLIKLQTKQ